MSAWSHLPNAKHIDWVLASVKQHPEIWAATWDAICDAAWAATWAATWAAAYDAVYDTAWNVAWDAAAGVMLSAARGAILALIAYDDCGHLLDMPSEQLKTWAVLTEKPAAILLLPSMIAREQIRELENV